MSVKFRQFMAKLAVDPEAYGRFLANADEEAEKAKLSIEDVKALKSTDQHHMYTALTSDQPGSEAPE